MEKAGNDDALRRTAEEFFADLTPVAAAEIFARPLALSAAGRIVKLEAPARRSVDAKGIAIPSFTSNAKGNWTFSLVDAPSKNRLPGAVTVEWLGVPNAEDLRSSSDRRRAVQRDRAGERPGARRDRAGRAHVAALPREL